MAMAELVGFSEEEDDDSEETLAAATQKSCNGSESDAIITVAAELDSIRMMAMQTSHLEPTISAAAGPM